MEYWNPNQQMEQPDAPVNEGENYDVKIESVGRDGDGIARVNGFVIFVPNTKIGDELKIRVTKVTRRVAFAEPLETE